MVFIGAASTVSREISAATVADQPIAPMLRTSKRMERSCICGQKRCLLAVNSELRDVVAKSLMLDWSPEQIAGWPEELSIPTDGEHGDRVP